MIEKYALVKVTTAIMRDSDEFSIRNVSKRAGVSPSTAKASLDFLFSHRVLEKRKIGKNVLFKVSGAMLARQIKILFSVAEINAAGFAEELIKAHPGIVSICIYGSVAKGEDSWQSDIDMLVISRTKIKARELRSEKLINREVAALYYTYKEWEEKSRSDKAFYYDVILNALPLYGEKPVVD